MGQVGVEMGKLSCKLKRNNPRPTVGVCNLLHADVRADVQDVQQAHDASPTTAWSLEPVV